MPERRRDPEALLRRLEWTVLRRLDGQLHGDYRTLFRGFGLDLADLREYQYHDDVRHIDWNVTARLQTPYVRQYHEDREVTAWFLLDLSASVDFGSTAKKTDVALDFVALLARVLTRRGNRVGALIYRNGVEQVIPPRSGRRHVLHLLAAMQKPSPHPSRPTDLRELFGAAAQMIRRRALLFVVSDFFSAPGWGEALARLVPRHETVAIRLFDPLESELPDLGLLALRDAETGEQILVDLHDARFRRRFAQAAERRERQVREQLAAAGVDTLELSTGDDLTDSILRFADLRKRRAQFAQHAAARLPAHLQTGVS